MSQLLVRDYYLALLQKITDPGLVRVVTGVRRCGKSALLELYREELVGRGIPSSQILAINFEDATHEPLRDPKTFLDYVTQKKIRDNLRYLHIDEVQELKDWSRVINSLRLPEDLEICVTGSNASMFSGESTTYLAGRYLEIPMFPLSLTEFRQFRAQDGHPENSLDACYRDWTRIGGFPASVLTTDPNIVSQLNASLFDSIFTRDISLRGQIRDPQTLLRVARFVFDTVGSPVSPNRIVGHLKAQGYSISPETVDRYLALMEEAHLIYHCQRYDTQGRHWLSTNGKYYFVDTALRGALLGTRNFNRGADLENQVFLELRRRGYQVATGAVSLSGSRGEIDFIATKGNQNWYIQVSYLTESAETLSRELRPFAGVPVGANCILMTMDRAVPETGEIRWIDVLEFLNGTEL